MTEQNVSPVSADEIKPCPFCGAGGDRIIIQEQEPHKHAFATFMPDHHGSATIECAGCNIGMVEDTKEKVIAAWNRRAPAASGATPEGWKLVPVEPTPEMVIAFNRGIDFLTWGDCFRAMIAAAPLPPDPNAGPEPSGTSPDFGY